MLKVLFSRKCRCDVKQALIIVLVCLSGGWVGVDVKPLSKLEVPQFLRELPSLRNAPRGFNLFEAIIVLLG